jgi:hypothetical protein
MEAATSYLEALRYMDNAKENLQKAGKDEGLYKDKKYVRTASGIAYNAILIALDEYLHRKEGNSYKKAKSIEEYKSRITNKDKKLLTLLVSAYDTLHINGYYIGTTSVKTITSGFEDAYKIIEYIKD